MQVFKSDLNHLIITEFNLGFKIQNQLQSRPDNTSFELFNSKNLYFAKGQFYKWAPYKSQAAKLYVMDDLGSRVRETEKYFFEPIPQKLVYTCLKDNLTTV